jgi:UDP-N-acetylmuramoyl-tripeptide--D-alanyl-D-alanine ligase
MSRFLPAQLRAWTEGRLLQTPDHAADPERFYGAVSKDSRTLEPGQAYIALIGPNFDGHSFCSAALEAGALLLIVKEDHPVALDLAERFERGVISCDLLFVNDTWQAYQDIAYRYRLSLTAAVIGVTGSVGKTTTRRMIHCAIRSQLRAMQSFANLNNEIGLSQTLLNAQPDDQVLVTEIAMDRPGEIAKLSGIARPDYAVITNIGHSHAEYLGSVRAILQEKVSIAESMKANGVLILNGDDAMLEAWAVQSAKKTSVWFVASEKNSGRLERDGYPVFWPEEIEATARGTDFVVRSSFAPADRWKVSLPVPGKHLIHAALFGMASAYALGLDMEEAGKSLSEFENTGGRQRIVNADAHDITIIDDAYNTSPEAMQSAIQVMNTIAGERRKLCVFGGMRELGKYSDSQHIVVARALIEAGVSSVLTIGEETRPLDDYFRSHGITDAWHFESRDELLDTLLATVRRGDVILVKGSRLYELDQITRALEETYV